MSAHVRGIVNELGYDRGVCVECGVTWPCPEWVKERCERMDIAHALPCSCGWHEATDVFLAQDPEQEKVPSPPAMALDDKHEPDGRRS